MMPPRTVALTYALFALASACVSIGLSSYTQGLSQRIGLVCLVAVSGYTIYLLLVHAQQTYRVEDHRWRSSFEAIGYGVWEMNLSTREVVFSDGWRQLLGFGPDEMPRTLHEWCFRAYPFDQLRLESSLRACLDGHSQTLACEYRMQNQDGTYRWVSVRGCVVQNALASAGVLVGTHTDITSRKTAEAEKAETLAFLEAVLASSTVGIVVYRADGSVAVANLAAAAISGQELEALRQQNRMQNSPWLDPFVADAEWALLSEKEVGFRGKMIDQQGEPKWLVGHFVPFTFSKKKHLLVHFVDDSATYLATEELRLLQAAVQSSPVGWVVTDIKGDILSVNPAFTRITGYAQEEVLGKNPRFLKSGKQGPEVYAAMWQTLRQGATWSGMIINKRKDGTYYHEETTISPIKAVDGTVTQYVAVKIDVTDRELLTSQVSRSQRMESIGHLAAGVVHDLNNILTPIMMSLAMMRDMHSDQETRNHVKLMETSVHRGAGVLRQVLTFARGVEGERAQLKASTILREVAHMAEETFPRQIRIETSIARDIGLIVGDVTQIHQVLLNLAVNARDAMPLGGVLTIYAENACLDREYMALHSPESRPGKYVRLGVRDTGTGMSEEVMERMFEPFYTTKVRDKGTGLGLSTAFGIVRSHSGFFECDSELGKGTDIRFLLPASNEQIQVSVPQRGTTTRAPFRCDGLRILVVEDEPAVLLTIKKILERRGVQVTTACDGLEALERYRASPQDYDVILTDLMMPRMDGYDLAAHIRKLSSDIPIVASTGMSGSGMANENVETLHRIGVKSIIGKPYDEDTLFRTLVAEAESSAQMASNYPS